MKRTKCQSPACGACSDVHKQRQRTPGGSRSSRLPHVQCTRIISADVCRSRFLGSKKPGRGFQQNNKKKFFRDQRWVRKDEGMGEKRVANHTTPPPVPYDRQHTRTADVVNQYKLSTLAFSTPTKSASARSMGNYHFNHRHPLSVGGFQLMTEPLST